MKLNFTDEEAKIFCELVYLGNWLINSHRLHEEKIWKYEEFAERVALLHNEILTEKEKNLYGSTYDLCFETLEKYIDEYADEECFPKLAEKLAKAYFPVSESIHFTNYCGSVNMRIAAQKIYEKELLEKGVSILSIDIPDILDRLEICRQKFRKGK